MICARIVGWCFKEYHEIFLGTGEDDRSNLWKMNVYEREYYDYLPAPKKNQQQAVQRDIVSTELDVQTAPEAITMPLPEPTAGLVSATGAWVMPQQPPLMQSAQLPDQHDNSPIRDLAQGRVM